MLLPRNPAFPLEGLYSLFTDAHPKNHACKITSVHQLLDTGSAERNSLPEDNWAWLPAQFQQKMDFVKPTKTMPSIRRTTKQNILTLIGFAIKRYTEHVMQLILHKVGQELNAKALGYFFKWSICLFPTPPASLHTKIGGTETFTHNCSRNNSAWLYFFKGHAVLEMMRFEAWGPVWKASRTTRGDEAVSCPLALGSINQQGLIVNPAAYGFQLINMCSCLALNWLFQKFSCWKSSKFEFSMHKLVLSKISVSGISG